MACTCQVLRIIPDFKSLQVGQGVLGLSVIDRALTHIFEKAGDLIKMLLAETCRMKRAVIGKNII